MFSILESILGAGMKWALSYFMLSKDERLGRAEANSVVLTQELKNVEIKNRIDGLVESSSAADIKRMSADLDSADR